MTRSHLPEVLRLEHGWEGLYSVTQLGWLIGLAIRPHPDKVDIEPSPIRFASAHRRAPRPRVVAYAS